MSAIVEDMPPMLGAGHRPAPEVPPDCGRPDLDVDNPQVPGPDRRMIDGREA